MAAAACLRHDRHGPARCATPGFDPRGARRDPASGFGKSQPGNSSWGAVIPGPSPSPASPDDAVATASRGSAAGVSLRPAPALGPLPRSKSAGGSPCNVRARGDLASSPRGDLYPVAPCSPTQGATACPSLGAGRPPPACWGHPASAPNLAQTQGPCARGPVPEVVPGTSSVPSGPSPAANTHGRAPAPSSQGEMQGTAPTPSGSAAMHGLAPAPSCKAEIQGKALVPSGNAAMHGIAPSPSCHAPSRGGTAAQGQLKLLAPVHHVPPPPLQANSTPPWSGACQGTGQAPTDSHELALSAPAGSMHSWRHPHLGPSQLQEPSPYSSAHAQHHIRSELHEAPQRPPEDPSGGPKPRGQPRIYFRELKDAPSRQPSRRHTSAGTAHVVRIPRSRSVEHPLPRQLLHGRGLEGHNSLVASPEFGSTAPRIRRVQSSPPEANPGYTSQLLQRAREGHSAEDMPLNSLFNRPGLQLSCSPGERVVTLLPMASEACEIQEVDGKLQVVSLQGEGGEPSLYVPETMEEQRDAADGALDSPSEDQGSNPGSPVEATITFSFSTRAAAGSRRTLALQHTRSLPAPKVPGRPPLVPRRRALDPPAAAAPAAAPLSAVNAAAAAAGAAAPISAVNAAAAAPLSAVNSLASGTARRPPLSTPGFSGRPGNHPHDGATSQLRRAASLPMEKEELPALAPRTPPLTAPGGSSPYANRDTLASSPWAATSSPGANAAAAASQAAQKQSSPVTTLAATVLRATQKQSSPVATVAAAVLHATQKQSSPVATAAAAVHATQKQSGPGPNVAAARLGEAPCLMEAKKPPVGNPSPDRGIYEAPKTNPYKGQPREMQGDPIRRVSSMPPPQGKRVGLPRPWPATRPLTPSHLHQVRVDPAHRIPHKAHGLCGPKGFTGQGRAEQHAAVKGWLHQAEAIEDAWYTQYCPEVHKNDFGSGHFEASTVDLKATRSCPAEVVRMPKKALKIVIPPLSPGLQRSMQGPSSPVPHSCLPAFRVWKWP